MRLCCAVLRHSVGSIAQGDPRLARGRPGSLASRKDRHRATKKTIIATVPIESQTHRIGPSPRNTAIAETSHTGRQIT